MQKISHSQSIEVGLLFMGLSNIRALRLVLIYFHIPKKTTRFMFPSFCSALSDSLSWLLSSAGFVPLFSVCLAMLAPFTCPNVCSVHLAMSTCSALSNRHLLWAFPAKGRKVKICLFGHKLLQLDTNQTPRLSSKITLHLFKVVSITLPQ